MALRTRGDVVVVGSANQDYLMQVPHPPAPGETILASSLVKQPGGKGANQAVAAARLGARVRLLAAVGDDPDGVATIQQLHAEGVDTDVDQVPGLATGLALVSVYPSGENSIVVVPGANASLDPDQVRARITEWAGQGGAAVLVTQAEVDPAITEAAIRTAAMAGVRVLCNLAPYRELSADLLAWCDPLVVNETEASGLLGDEILGVDAALDAVASLRLRTRSVVVTVGAQGACWADQDHASVHCPAPSVEVTDTTGAGDAFVGAVAARLANGDTLDEAVQVGVAAGSFAVTRPGAQSSYPRSTDLSPRRTT